MGQALLQGRWEAAVRLILTPSDSQREDATAACRLYLDKKDAKGALAAMPNFMIAERSVLQVATFFITANQLHRSCFANLLQRLYVKPVASSQ